MSGTQDTISAEILQQSDTVGEKTVENAAEAENAGGKNNLTPSQKMDMLLRGATPKGMKREIEKLRKESAKYRTSAREEAAQRSVLQEKADVIQKELDNLKESNRNLKIMRALDNAGCLKSDLVAKDIPADCSDFEEFIENYKNENGFLFGVKKQTHGGNFKPHTSQNLTPSQRMDNYIRRALRRG